MKGKRFLAALLALALAGCGAPGSAPEPPQVSQEPAVSGEAAPENAAPLAEAAERNAPYTIRLDTWRTLVIDQDGTFLPEDQNYEVVKGVDGAPQCRRYTRIDDSGQEDEYGNPIGRYMSALYDLDGNLLADWEEITYREGFGDFLVRTNDPQRMMRDFDLMPGFHTELWNFKTGQTVAGVDYVQDLGDGHYLALGVGEVQEDMILPQMVPLGVLDADGNVVSGFPGPEGYSEAQAWNGLIIAANWQGADHSYENMRHVVLNQAFEPLFSHQIINEIYMGLRGPYLLAEDGNRSNEENDNVAKKILSAEGEVLYTAAQGEAVTYYDGECMILQQGRYWDDAPPQLRLASADGTVLGEGFDILEPESSRWDTAQIPSERFIAIRKDGGGVVELLDRQGKTLASAQFPGVDSVNGIGGGYFTYSFPDGQVGVLDNALQVVIPAEQYRYIQRVNDWESGENYDLWECNKELPGEIYRVDIRALDGTLLISNLTQLYSAGPDRLAVIRGFSAGLMDWEGNWIAKQPIFNDFEDERSMGGWL